MKETIAIACDHAGYIMKEMVVDYLKQNGYDVKDFGTYSEESCDYPDYVHKLGKAIDIDEYEKGFVLCGSANGVNMTVNKYKNVRSALCWQIDVCEMSRLHNDANVCAIPARYISNELCVEIVQTFLDTEFEGGRHIQRVEKIKGGI